MSYEEIKKLSEAYLSIYKVEDTEVVNEETGEEEQLDEARKPNSRALVKRIEKMRSQDVDDMYEKISDWEEAYQDAQDEWAPSPIPSKLLGDYKKGSQIMRDALRSIEEIIRRS